jgi:hypothetical protein
MAIAIMLPLSFVGLGIRRDIGFFIRQYGTIQWHFHFIFFEILTAAIVAYLKNLHSQKLKK